MKKLDHKEEAEGEQEEDDGAEVNTAEFANPLLNKEKSPSPEPSAKNNFGLPEFNSPADIKGFNALLAAADVLVNNENEKLLMFVPASPKEHRGKNNWVAKVSKPPSTPREHHENLVQIRSISIAACGSKTPLPQTINAFLAVQHDLAKYIEKLKDTETLSTFCHILFPRTTEVTGKQSKYITRTLLGSWLPHFLQGVSEIFKVNILEGRTPEYGKHLVVIGRKELVLEAAIFCENLINKLGSLPNFEYRDAVVGALCERMDAVNDHSFMDEKADEYVKKFTRAADYTVYPNSELQISSERL